LAAADLDLHDSSLAYAEASLILARLLWNFDVSLDEKSMDWSKDMKAYIMWEKEPLYVNLRVINRGK